MATADPGVQVLQVRDDAGVGKQRLHLAQTVIATGKDQPRGHARPLNANAGSRFGSQRGNHGEVANACEEHGSEQAKVSRRSLRSTFQGAPILLEYISHKYILGLR